jgi:hypothetical protein
MEEQTVQHSRCLSRSDESSDVILPQYRNHRLKGFSSVTTSLDCLSRANCETHSEKWESIEVVLI